MNQQSQRMQLSIETELFILFAEEKLQNFSDYKRFAEFLGVYHYVLPKDRKISKELMEEIFFWRTPKTSSEFFFLWHVINILEQCMAEESQKELLIYLRSLPILIETEEGESK